MDSLIQGNTKFTHAYLKLTKIKILQNEIYFLNCISIIDILYTITHILIFQSTEY